jgi:twinkle protein
MDIRGGSAITDLADTVLVMWRNKIRELAIITANAKDEPVEEKYENMYHAILACEKQRNGEWEKSICLWWDVESFQFLDKPLGEPKRYARD